MSKLSELIARLCPDGVEYLQIQEVVNIKPGRDYKHLQSGNIPVYGSGGIMTYVDECSYNRPTVLLPRKGSISNIFYVDEPFWNVDTIYYTEIDETKIMPRFFYHVMCHEHIEKLNTSNAARPALTREVLNKIKIPVPPLEVQAEIVRILDDFALATDKLAEELNAELTARKKQYEYYRDLLLTFDNAECPWGGDTHSRSAKLAVRWAKLGDEFPLIRNGFVGTVTPYFTDKTHGIRYLKGTNIHDGVISDNDVCYINRAFNQKHCQTILKADDILVVQSGHVGECAVVGKQYEGANCHALIVMSNGGKCDSKYISYYLQSREGKRKLKRITTGGTVKHILASQIKNVIVPVPPLSEQRRIVAILDRFDALCHDISAGLPAEIAARKKQYAYYRDKLLTFKEKVA